MRKAIVVGVALSVVSCGPKPANNVQPAPRGGAQMPELASTGGTTYAGVSYAGASCSVWRHELWRR